MAKESSPKPAGLRLFGSQGAARSIKDRKSTRLNSSHSQISYAVFCLKKKKARSIERLAGAVERSVPRLAGLEEEFLWLMPGVLPGVSRHYLQAAFLPSDAPKVQPPL